MKKAKLQELLQLRKTEELEFKKSGRKNYRELAEENFRKRLTEFELSVREEDITYNQPFDEDDDEAQAKIVNDVFGFLYEDGKSKENAVFEVSSCVSVQRNYKRSQ